MPDLSWAEVPTWILSITIGLWLVVRSAAWALQIRQALETSHPPRPSNGASAEWRGETRQVLKQLRAALSDSTTLDREMLAVLREVRDELRDHNSGAHRRHKLVEEIHQAIMRQRRG